MRAFLDAEARRLLRFAEGAVDPRGGFGWLDDDGRLDPSQPLHLWVNARLTHVFGLGELLDVPGAGALCDRGLEALTGLLHDDEHGGWWSAVDADGAPTRTRKSAYDHAFVLLAATTAVQAGRPGAEPLLRQVIDVIEQHFWDDDAGASRGPWRPDQSRASPSSRWMRETPSTRSSSPRA
ncbi:MAG: AGE family epimerase/isomerase [Motilibacteraceae bacterium]